MSILRYLVIFSVIYVCDAFGISSLYLNRRESLFLAAGSPLLFTNEKPICVIGGSGETGRECVKFLAEQGKRVRSISRTSFDVRNINDGYQKNVESLNLDLKRDNIDDVIKGSSSVIFLANAKKKFKYIKSDMEEFQNYEDIDVIGVKKVVDACVKKNIRRFIYVSATCRSCLSDESQEYDKISGIECENCISKQMSENIIKKTGLDYTIVRIGFLINGENRGPKELELTQDYTKSGMISRYDLANICINAIDDKNTIKTTFEAYYRDTTQPYDVKESITKCTNLGKSVEECFFGSSFKDEKPKSIEDVRNKPIKGSLFTTGNEFSGESWYEIFKDLKKDR